MIFCNNCGEKVIDGAKFCQKCGVPTHETSSNHESQRQQEYAGKSYKCPNCGEILKSFVTNCPSCGFELRGTKTTSAVREFAVKLEAIEAHREHTKPAGMFNYRHLLEISKTDQQKINLIQNFSFPNTKEDMLEFMILATSNIDTSTLIGDGKVTEKAISKAWDSKIKQVYAKAKNTYIDDPDFSKIQDLYNSYHIDAKKHKKKNIIYLIGFIGLILLFIFGPFILIANDQKNDYKKEETRLESIVIEIDDALGKGEYKRALMNAELMEYNGYNKERDSYWDVRQRYLIEEILHEAEKHGVELYYTPPAEEAEE